jgi:uncharacterized protein (DUF58 family)
MPTSRGWAAVGVSGALLVLWATFGEIELLATAVFLLLAVGGGILFVRLVAPRLEVTRKINPSPVHEGEQVTVEVETVSARTARNLSLEDTVHGLGAVRFAAAHTTPGQRLVARYDRPRRRWPIPSPSPSAAPPSAPSIGSPCTPRWSP